MKPLFLLYIAFLFFGQIQAQSIDHRPVTLQKHRELTSDRLSEAQIQAYHKRARQKLGDMVDYIQFALNARQVAEQQLALKQLRKLFREAPGWATSRQNLRAYWGKVTNFELKSVRLTQSLTPNNEGQYLGKLACQIANKSIKLDFIVQKRVKYIGNSRVVVWKLLF